MTAIPPEHDGWVVAEVSSYQAAGCPEFLPSAAILTNLSNAHLGRHGSMAGYAAAKRRLFVRGDRAVSLAALNADDEFGWRLAAEVSERGGRTVTYGFAPDADVRIRSCRSSLRTGTVEIDVFGDRVEFETRLPGAHNAANVAAGPRLRGGTRPAAREDVGGSRGQHRPCRAGSSRSTEGNPSTWSSTSPTLPRASSRRSAWRVS